MDIKIRHIGGAVDSSFDHDTFEEFKAEVFERLKYLSDRMSEVYELESVEGIPELQYAVGDVMNLLELVTDKVRRHDSVEPFKYPY
jgi:hypothetical protein